MSVKITFFFQINSDVTIMIVIFYLVLLFGLIILEPFYDVR